MIVYKLTIQHIYLHCKDIKDSERYDFRKADDPRKKPQDSCYIGVYKTSNQWAEPLVVKHEVE
jgi:hypothetical protein